MPSPEKFRKTLARQGVPDDVIHRIDSGFEGLKDSSGRRDRALYFQRAVSILKNSVSEEDFRTVFESNACCKGGIRLKNAREFAQKYAGLSLRERLAKIPEVPYMGSAELGDDGTITVHAVSWKQKDGYGCACPNIASLAGIEAVDSGYCLCGAGHFRFYYEILLGVKLKTLGIVSSPLDTKGEKPCVMRFSIE